MSTSNSANCVINVFTVSRLPPPVQPSYQFAAPITVWSVAVMYNEDTGLRGMVPSGPKGTPTEIVRLQANSCIKSVMWAAQAWGAKPQCPSWDTGSPNEVLLQRVRGGYAPGNSIDGQQVWTIKGMYVYQLQQPPGDSDVLTIAIGPYDSRSVAVCQLTPADFLAQFVGPSATPQNFSGQLISY